MAMLRRSPRNFTTSPSAIVSLDGASPSNRVDGFDRSGASSRSERVSGPEPPDVARYFRRGSRRAEAGAMMANMSLRPLPIQPIQRSLTAVAAWFASAFATAAASAADSGVAVLFVDTDRVAGTVDERIYGHFLEHINHSVVDGLYAEQVRGQGFEAKDFADYWQPFGENGNATLVAEKFERGEHSVRLAANAGTAGVRQGRLYVEAAETYDGSVWLKPEHGKLDVSLRILSSTGRELEKRPLETTGQGWQEVKYKFTSSATDRQASLEIVATGTGSMLVDFVSLMRERARKNGKLRPDLLAALEGLAPPFIRWPGGSYASIYKWKDGIGPAVSRKYNPNTIWGGYSDYYGFGTDEFLELCRQLGAAPMVVLAATSTDAAELEYALEWVHYLVDPPTTEWGRRRAANGHREPYRVPYIQIDNEPMNHGLSPDAYAAIVNLYGPRLRQIAPGSKIVACGQKRSNDNNWSEKLIDLAGNNFDILGTHNYEYEPENYATGVRRIEDYLEKLIEYVRISAHPKIELAVLEWGSSRTYDWRAGLHAAGSLLSYEKLSPALSMTSPALLMRNTSDDPEWRSWIYHDHVSWFAGSGYVAEKLFRDYYAPRRHAFASGTFKDIPKRADFFDAISQMKPEDWTPNTVDAIATSTADGQRFIIKAVNYDRTRHTLLTRLVGSRAPAKAAVKLVTISAKPKDENSLAEPNKLRRVETTKPYARDMAFELEPYTVAVIEIRSTSPHNSGPPDRK
jgi:alpha-N-arabinofuranosidase